MMAITEMFSGLLEATLASSLAVLLVLSLRAPLRRAFGAGVAYGVWLLVPMALLAVAIPPAVAPLAWDGHAVMSVWHVLPADRAVINDGRVDAWWWMAAWSAGILLSLAWVVMQQRKFLDSLGPLQQRDDGLLQAHAVAGLPAAMGLWTPIIVVPADFDTRYSPRQRALMHAHEQAHIRHGDLHWNAAAALVRAVFWFNPLMHIAARCLRHDQELACDARVIARHPHARRAYGEAMLKTQLAGQSLPLGCHWGNTHPLKERIIMLNQPLPSLRRWVAGSTLITVLSLSTAVAAWASQPTDDVASMSSAATTASGQTISAKAPVASASSITQAANADAQAVHIPPPAYPKSAADQKIGGRVMLLVNIDPQGHVTEVEVETSQPQGVFDQVAVDAAHQWRFQPERKHGKPVASRVRVPVDFEPREPAESSNG